MIEKIVLENLARNEPYVRKVIPFIKKEYFAEHTDKILFGLISQYFEKYNRCPTAEALVIECESLTDVSDEHCKNVIQQIKSWKEETLKEMDWLVDQTEKFCQDKAIYNAIMTSIHLLDGKDKKQDKGAIPELLSNALAVTFDNHIGHDFIEDSENRYNNYHKVEEKIPFQSPKCEAASAKPFSIKVRRAFILSESCASCRYFVSTRFKFSF